MGWHGNLLFNPRHRDNSFHVSECDQIVNRLVLCTVGVKSNCLSIVHFKGEVNYQDNNVKASEHEPQSFQLNILLDTGALSANYISSQLLEEIKSWLPSDKVKRKKNVISLADDSRIIESNEVVELKLVIIGDNGERLSITEDFVSINMSDNDVIIGLPIILTKLWTFFKFNVESKQRKLSQ